MWSCRWGRIDNPHSKSYEILTERFAAVVDYFINAQFYNMQKRVRGILIKDGMVVLIKRTRDGETFYVFPGGGVEEGETDEDALKREMKEELGIDISVKELIAQQKFGKPKSKECMNFFYICENKGGKLGTGKGPEYTARNGYEGLHEPVELSLNEISKLELRPADVKDLVLKKYL